MQLYSTFLVENAEFTNSREMRILESLCGSVEAQLSPARLALTDVVAHRSVAIGLVMGVSGVDLIRLEAAARLHRLGELFLKASYRAKTHIEMTTEEIRTYRTYPVLTALRVSKSVVPEIYRILLRHREYCSGEGFLHSDRETLPLGARILCVATEYHELAATLSGDVMREDALQRRLLKNAVGRYDPGVVAALLKTLAAESGWH